MTDPTPIPCIMPILAGPEMTEAAIADLLAQSVPVRLLLINQGVDDAFRDRLERIAEQESDRVLVWSHQPSLPSLSASWNAALDWAWTASSAGCALVVNNDVRLHPQTVEYLQKIGIREQALFVSAVGVTATQFDGTRPQAVLDGEPFRKGGPDFSCFLISHACHDRFRFDEAFIPAFCEDLDYHRRLMLAGEGQRIFSVNLPYLHLASQTLKALPDSERERIRRQIETHSRAYYARKWGGPVNQETFWTPFDGPAEDVVVAPWPVMIAPTTTALFDYERAKWRVALGPPIDDLCRSLIGDPPEAPATPELFERRPESPLDSLEEIR